MAEMFKILSDEEIETVIQQEDYKASGEGVPIPVVPLRYEKAAATAQLRDTLRQFKLKMNEITCLPDSEQSKAITALIYELKADIEAIE